MKRRRHRLISTPQAHPEGEEQDRDNCHWCNTVGAFVNPNTSLALIRSMVGPLCNATQEVELTSIHEDVSESVTYTCTKPKGHRGRHMACGKHTHNLHTWSQT